MYKKKTKQKLFMNFMTLMTLSHTGISINFMFETTMIYVCVKKLSRFLGIEYRYFNFCYYDWPLCILLCFFLFFVSCDFYFTLLSVYFYWNWANAWIPFLSFSFGYSYKNKYYFLDVVALFAMNQNLFVVIPWHRCNYILILRKQIGAKQNNIKTNCRTHQTDFIVSVSFFCIFFKYEQLIKFEFMNFPTAWPTFPFTYASRLCSLPSYIYL